MLWRQSGWTKPNGGEFVAGPGKSKRIDKIARREAETYKLAARPKRPALMADWDTKPGAEQEPGERTEGLGQRRTHEHNDE
jgi:hypothetical protein